MREADGGSPELNLIRMAVGMHNAMTEISNIFKARRRARDRGFGLRAWWPGRRTEKGKVQQSEAECASG